MENVDISNELPINYLCQHIEVGLIGDAQAFSLKSWYCIIFHIGAISIRISAESGCSQHQLAVAHTVFLSVDGIDYSGRSPVILVKWYNRGGAGVSREARLLRTIHHTNRRDEGV